MSSVVPDRHESGWGTTSLLPSVQVLASETIPALDPATDTVLAALWEQACRERPSLFNGRVFAVDRVGPDRIEGHWTEYRQMLARLTRPDLFPAPHPAALAVNGLVACTDGLVLGRRQAKAVYRPGVWQAAPAGSIEFRDGATPVDFRAQLLAELSEELGLKEADRAAIEPVVAIEHPNRQVVDIGCLLTVPVDFATVERRWRQSGNGEYDALRLVAPSDVRSIMQQTGSELLGSARILLGCWLDRQQA